MSVKAVEIKKIYTELVFCRLFINRIFLLQEACDNLKNSFVPRLHGGDFSKSIDQSNWSFQKSKLSSKENL